ncbi:MAG: NAD(P)-dependent oxidoreductase [Planctomycetota bacterium]
MSGPFRVATTADFTGPDGNCRYRDIGLDRLEAVDGIDHAPLSEHISPIPAAQLAGVNALLSLTPHVVTDSLNQADDLLAIARFGVGYDWIDVDACTAHDVLLTITAGAVDRPVAEATVTWMLALSHRLLAKDRLVREARWDDRAGFMGSELRDRRLGIIGCGGIARGLLSLLRSFGMGTPLACDPFLKGEQAAELGVERVELDELLRQADFVSVHCPLTEQTRNLIGARELALMQPHAYLINTARGGIVDEEALYQALVDGRIAGAGIDCFVDEPITTPPRLAELDQVLLAPHCIAWTDELFRDIGRMACTSIVDLAQGRRPHGVVNPAVLEKPSFQEKWRRLALQAVQA